MKKPYTINELDSSTSILVNDGDRQVLFVLSRPVKIAQGDAVVEARRVRKEVVREEAPVWVLETIDKYIQTLR